jgi:hypothetical protein
MGEKTSKESGMEIQILYEAALWYEDKNECSMAFWIQVLGNPSWT